MLKIMASYSQLYNLLKTKGLEYLIEKDIFDENGKRALKIIAQLAHPNEVEIVEIKSICEECIRGSLELVSQIAGIGKLSRNIIKLTEEIEDYYIEPIKEVPKYDTESINDMLKWNNKMMLNMSFGINRILRQTDINLKGRCPFCHGDLVEVIYKDELRLRCKQQTKSDCRDIDWFVQDLLQKSP